MRGSKRRLKAVNGVISVKPHAHVGDPTRVGPCRPAHASSKTAIDNTTVGRLRVLLRGVRQQTATMRIASIELLADDVDSCQAVAATGNDLRP